MLKTLLFRSWRRHLRVIWGWIGFCILISLYNYVLYAYLLSNPDYTQYLGLLPNWTRLFLNHQISTVTPASFLQLTTFNFTLPLVWVILAVYITLMEIAGDEESGCLFFILYHPVKRWKLYLIKSLALIVTIIIMGIVFWGCMTLTVKVINAPVDQGWIAWNVLSIGLFIVFTVGFSMGIGAWQGRTDPAALITIALLIFMWVIDRLTWTGVLSQIFQWFNPYSLMLVETAEKGAFASTKAGILIAYIMVIFVIGMIAWQRRNFWGQKNRHYKDTKN